MKLLALSGSRNHEGRTAQAIEAICRGMTNSGGTAGTIFLVESKLGHCIQCEQDGWGICRREGYCIIKDDFDSVVQKVKEADVLLFATPVYFGDLSESMRNFLERLRRISFRQGQRPPGSLPLQPDSLEQTRTPTVGLCLSGGGGGGGPSCAVNLERILQTCGFDIVDWILLRRQNFEVKLPMLEVTGEWLATKPTSGPPGPPR